LSGGYRESSFFVGSVEREGTDRAEVVLVKHRGSDGVIAEPDHSATTDGGESRVLEGFDFEHDANIRREVETFTVRKSKKFVVIENTEEWERVSFHHHHRGDSREEALPVEILDPFGIHVSIEDDPVTLGTFSPNIVDNLAKDMSEESVVPFPRRRIESTVECFLRDRFRVDNVRNSFDSGEAFESCEKDSPGSRFAGC
jgi:hypothetical protein